MQELGYISASSINGESVSFLNINLNEGQNYYYSTRAVNDLNQETSYSEIVHLLRTIPLKMLY